MDDECQGKRRILLIEEKADIRRFTARVLSLEGYEVLQAVSAEEGLRVARNAPGISVVLLGLELSNHEGWKLLKEFRNDPELSGVPIVVFSIYALPWHQSKALRMGASAYLTMPTGVSELKKTVAAVLH